MADIATRPLLTLTLHGIEIHRLGRTPAGDRLIGVVAGGRFEGERLRGTVLPGGNDWIVGRADGTWAIDVRLPLRTDDGALIGMSYRGVRLAAPEVLERVRRGDTVERSEFFIRMAVTFETSAPRYDWINRVLGLGLGRPVPDGVTYQVFEVV
jgi:hypothetical protein